MVEKFGILADVFCERPLRYILGILWSILGVFWVYSGVFDVYFGYTLVYFRCTPLYVGILWSI